MFCFNVEVSASQKGPFSVYVQCGSKHSTSQEEKGQKPHGQKAELEALKP